MIFTNINLKVFMSGNPVATGILDKSGTGALHVLEGKPYVDKKFAHIVQVRNGTEDWRKRLQHVNPEKLVRIANQGLANGLQVDGDTKLPFCERC